MTAPPPGESPLCEGFPMFFWFSWFWCLVGVSGRLWTTLPDAAEAGEGWRRSGNRSRPSKTSKKHDFRNARKKNDKPMDSRMLVFASACVCPACLFVAPRGLIFPRFRASYLVPQSKLLSTHPRTDTRAHTYTHIHTHTIHTHTHTCMHEHRCAHTQRQTHTHTHTPTHTYTQSHTQTHIHTQTPTHTHTDTDTDTHTHSRRHSHSDTHTDTQTITSLGVA